MTQLEGGGMENREQHLRDRRFAWRVYDILTRRRLINANQKAGVTHAAPLLLDDISPEVFISEAEIRRETGRGKLTRSTYDSLQLLFREVNQQLSATTEFDGGGLSRRPVGLRVMCLSRSRTTNNTFASLGELHERNEREAQALPTAGTPSQ
jgi:hypothetical protein